MSSLCGMLFLSLVFWVNINADCTYVNFVGYATPTDVCALIFSYSDTTQSSYEFKCTSNGVELLFYDNDNCDGDPTTKQDLDSSYDHNCDGSSDDCSTATWIQEPSTCSSTSVDGYSQITVVTDLCSYSADLSGSSMSECGYIDLYNNTYCGGKPYVKIDWEDSNCVDWSCTDTNSSDIVSTIKGIQCIQYIYNTGISTLIH